jgi:tryptophanyl-tRNA synthetase
LHPPAVTTTKPRSRVFSGIKPTGKLTLGNYLGAIKNWVARQDDSDCIFCIVNDHAITVRIDPRELRENTREVAATYLACGLLPERCILFVQSDVTEHTDLAWILNSVTQYGELHRMTQFKDKSGKGNMASVSAGLLNYPILMASDILLYGTNEVPVGEDQKQHVELCRDIALRFNRLYGETFTIPEPVIPKLGARIMSLDDPTRKMDKSNPSPSSYILLTDPPEAIQKKIARAVTDSGTEVSSAPDKPALTNLLTIYSLLSGRPIAEIESSYAGKGYGSFKKDLGEVVVGALEPVRAKIARYMDDAATLDRVLDAGAERARAIARPMLDLVKRRMGLAWREPNG